VSRYTTNQSEYMQNQREPSQFGLCSLEPLQVKQTGRILNSSKKGKRKYHQVLKTQDDHDCPICYSITRVEEIQLVDLMSRNIRIIGKRHRLKKEFT
jgi:hypothetical protein